MIRLQYFSPVAVGTTDQVLPISPGLGRKVLSLHPLPELVLSSGRTHHCARRPVLRQGNHTPITKD